MRPLSECGVVILGGTAGAGLATAVAFAGHGARTVLLGRNPERGAAACARCREAVPGAQADFACYEVDPMTASIDELRPVLTVSLGREVYAR